MAKQAFCDYEPCRAPIDRRVPESASVRVKFDATGTVMDEDDGREPAALIAVTVLGEYHDACFRDLVESRLLFAGRVDGLVRQAMRAQYPADDGIAATAEPTGEAVAS